MISALGGMMTSQQAPGFIRVIVGFIQVLQ